MADAKPSGLQPDLNQAMQMLRWLDEEQRKTKTLVAELQKKADSQADLAVGLGRRLEDLEARLASTQQALRHFDQIDAGLQQVRAEAGALLPKFEHALAAALEQAAQIRAGEREREGRTLQELRAGLDPLPEIQRRLEAFAVEDRRLNERFAPIQVRLEELAASIEAQASRTPYLEHWAGQLAAQVSELKQVEERMRADLAAALEQIRRAEEHQRQQLSQWARETLEYRKKIDERLMELPPLHEAYEQARRAVVHLEGLDQEIRREQAKIDHLLEVSEERSQQKLAEWRAEFDKNWEQHVTLFELYRQQQQEALHRMLARLDTLEQVDSEQSERWNALRETWSEQTRRQLQEVARIQQEIEATVAGKKKRL